MIKQYESEELNQTAEDELGKTKGHIAALSKQVEEILGDYYDQLYDYFYDIITAPYDFKIFVARRCLVLFQIFCQIINLEDPTPDREGILLSDWAIAKYRDQFLKKKVLIIDDILIHGRRAGHVYDAIKDYMDVQYLDIRVYMMTDSVKSLREEVLAKVQHTEDAHEWGWKNLSDRIVRAIYVSNIPYTSFVGAYRIPEINDEFQKGCTEAEIIDNSNCSQEEQDCSSRIFYCNRTEPDLFRIFTYVNCVRVYSNKKIEMMTLIPYSFTKALRKSTLGDFFKEFANQLSKWPYIKSDLLANEDSELYNMYKIRLFDAIISHFYGLYFFYNKFQPKNFDYDTLSKSFGEEIAKEFREMKYKDIQPMLESSYSDMEKYICGSFNENELLQGVYDAQLKNGFAREHYRNYLSENRNKDEEQARMKKDRLRGISIDYIFRSVGDIKNRRIIAAELLNSMDAGCASAVYNISEERDSYASFISPGEQSFRIILEKYPHIIRQMISLEEKKQNVEKYLDYLHDKGLIDEGAKSELQQFYQKNSHHLIDWNILTILENRKMWPTLIKDWIQENQEYLEMILIK